MDTSDDELRLVSKVLSRRLCTLYERSSAHTSIRRNLSVVHELLKSHKLKIKAIDGGSWAEGTMTATSDYDMMFLDPSMLVVYNSREIKGDSSNVLIVNKRESLPGYTRLQNLDENVFKPPLSFQQYFERSFERTSDGIFLSSVKLVESLVDDSRKGAETPGRHGPCVSIAADNYTSYLVNHKTGQKPDIDIAFGLVCYSWPEESMEWFTRNRKHHWPSKDLINKIRKKDCYVVPVGNPTSRDPSLQWRFSFLLAERQMIWSFNDTQIQCYVILKSLIKKYINPKVPDEVTSYHLKTIVFWQSENLGISAWSEDQLLQCVHDCLSYLSQCVQDSRLEHYFFRSNNLFRHKLTKPDDRKFVLDKIEYIKLNLAVTVPDIFPGNDVFTMRSRFGPDNVERILTFLNDASQYDYKHLKCAIEKFIEYTTGIFLTFRTVTNLLNDVNLLQWALEALKKKPPPDVDPIYIEHTLQCIEIRLAIHHYNTSQDNSLSQEAKRNLKEKSLDSMTRGAEIDDEVGKLYLATLYFCLEKYPDCESLILQLVKRRQKPLERLDNSLQVIHDNLPGIVDIMTKPDLNLMFSMEDVDFVPYPLKFECVMATQQPNPTFHIPASIYGLTLLFMTELSMNRKGLAHERLDRVASAVGKIGHTLLNHYRLFNLLGCCYLLDGQLHKAELCFIKSLTCSRGSPIGNTNAALYHLTILCFNIYTGRKSD